MSDYPLGPHERITDDGRRITVAGWTRPTQTFFRVRSDEDPGLLGGDLPFTDQDLLVEVPSTDPPRAATASTTPRRDEAPTGKPVQVRFVRVTQTRVINGTRLLWWDIRPADEVGT